MVIENRAQMSFSILYAGIIFLSVIFDSYWLSVLFLVPFFAKFITSPLVASFLCFLPLCVFPTYSAFVLSSSLFLLSLAEQLYVLPVTSVVNVVSDQVPILQGKLQTQEKLFLAEKKTLQETLSHQVQKCEDIQKEKTDVEFELESVQKLLQDARSALQESENQNRELNEQVTRYQDGSEVRILKSHFEEKKHELIELRRSLFLAQEEIELLERRLHDEKEQLDLKAFQTGRELFANLTNEVESLQSERQLLEEIIAQLQGGAHATHTA